MKLKFITKKGQIVIDINGQKIYYYTNREWFSSKLFEDGRGFDNLIVNLTRLIGSKPVPAKRYEYWCVDKEAYRVTGKVEIPMFSTTVFQEASDFKRNNPQSVIVRTCISGSRIVYQQITRHEVMSKYTTFDKPKSK